MHLLVRAMPILLGLLPSLAFAQEGLVAKIEPRCPISFSQTSSHATLVEEFGELNVAAEEVPGEMGIIATTVLFPDDPENRIEFLWNDEVRRRDPAAIIVRHPSRWPIGGVRTGASLAKVEKINGAPFKLRGFGWDQGGTTSDWRGGALSWPDADCRLAVRFEVDESTPESIWRKVTGHAEFLSSDDRMRAVNPTVSEIVVNYPE